MCKHVHVKRIALRQIDNRIKFHERRRTNARQLVHVITIRLDLYIGRYKIQVFKSKRTIRRSNACLVGPLCFCKAQCAVQFGNLYRRTGMEWSLLRNARDADTRPAILACSHRRIRLFGIYNSSRSDQIQIAVTALDF